MNAGELETSVLLAAHPSYVRHGWHGHDHIAPDRRYLSTVGGRRVYDERCDRVSSASHRHKGLCGPRSPRSIRPHAHHTAHQPVDLSRPTRGGYRPLTLPSAATPNWRSPSQPAARCRQQHLVRRFCQENDCNDMSATQPKTNSPLTAANCGPVRIFFTGNQAIFAFHFDRLTAKSADFRTTRGTPRSQRYGHDAEPVS